jgi:hypothetical protein
MTALADKIGDMYGDMLQVGDKILDGTERGTVTKIHDSADMEGDCPRVFVSFEDGTEQEYIAANQQTWYTDELAYRVEDISLDVLQAA